MAPPTKLNPYLVVLFTGFIFLIGSFVSMYYDFSLKNFVVMIRQITWQSNFFAFITALICIYKPNLSIFKTDAIFIMIASLLITSGTIFFFLLLPVYLSSNLLYYSSISIPLPINVFWNIWNHSVTPLSFVNLLVVRFRERSACLRINKKETLGRFGIYWLINIFSNMFFSFVGDQLLPYGAVTNWNWKKSTEMMKGLNGTLGSQYIIYNFQLAFFSFAIVAITTLFSLFIFWIFSDSSFRDKIRLNNPAFFSFNH